MINTSSLYRQLIKESGRTFRARILVTFADNSTAELTDKDIMQGSLVIKQSTSDEGSFTVGSAVIGELDFEIDNSSGTYDNTSFDGAVFDVRLGLVTEQKYDGTLTVEWLRKGIYTAEEITVNEKYIIIVAYDNIAKLDVPFADIGIVFPRTLAELYGRICTYCGISYASPNFANAGYIVGTDEYIDEDASCREVMSYIAQMARAFVSCDNVGTLHLRWYEEAVLGYDEAHNKIFYELNERQKINSTVQISGVRHIAPDETETLIGTDGYCMVIENNPLALNSSFLEHDVWTRRITGGLIGMKLIPFSSDVISDPSLEAGDIIKISDLNGNTYITPITNIIFRLDAKMTVSCDAETVNENNRTSASPSARIIARSKKNTAQQISQYDVRAKQFSQIAVNAMGFYQTDEVQNDGSTITYLHDKPLKADSTTIWKKTVDGFFVSNDGGQTYIAGIDSSGNAVLNILAVKGIIADWIIAGNFNADLITTGNINADLITTGNINADLITTGNINADLITTGNIDADLITTGNINADLIKAGILQDATGTTSINMATGEIKVAQSGGTRRFEIYSDGILLKNISDGSIIGGLGFYPPKVVMPAGTFDQLTIGGHQLQFISAKDASGNDCHVLGYY